MGDIAILIPYFNPVGYRSHLGTVKAAFQQAPVTQCFSTAVHRSGAGPPPQVRPSALCPGAGGVAGECWGAERSLFSSGPGLSEMALADWTGGKKLVAAEAAIEVLLRGRKAAGIRHLNFRTALLPTPAGFDASSALP